jgi:hypothetical protein
MHGVIGEPLLIGLPRVKLGHLNKNVRCFGRASEHKIRCR